MLCRWNGLAIRLFLCRLLLQAITTAAVAEHYGCSQYHHDCEQEIERKEKERRERAIANESGAQRLAAQCIQNVLEYQSIYLRDKVAGYLSTTCSRRLSSGFSSSSARLIWFSATLLVYSQLLFTHSLFPSAPPLPECLWPKLE